MSLFKKLFGTTETTFQLGGTTGVKIANNTANLEVKNAANNAFAKARALEIQTSNTINDVPTLLDIQEKVIQFSFAGATIPAAGTNTGKFGFCHTTGGSYTANDVVYDTGTAYKVLARESCKAIYTSAAISGTVSLNANGVYGWESTAYVLKGDGAATDTGIVKCIQIPLVFGSGVTVDSTTSIPSGAYVTRVVCLVSTLFNGTAPTVGVTVNGSSPVTIMATADNDLKLANQYEVEDVVSIGATGTGVVRASYTASTSTAGAATIFVFYTTPSA